MLFRLALMALLIPLAPAAAAAEAPIKQSIVRILTHSQRGDWYTPWNTGAAQQSSGSGFVVAGGLVMTNAHVVSDARVLFLYLDGDPTPHEARVHQIAHDCDLALVEPLEAGLLDEIAPLAFGQLPKLGTAVETFGYPSGGQRISSTRGVVSRIEINPYSHSGVDYHLTVQTDAAINPGNSGGPVLQGNLVVGVAFQVNTALENIGFFIPTEVVRHFLDDVRDGHYDGYPALGATTSNLENEAARRRAGLLEGESGVRVDFVFPQSSADGQLAPGDVILAIDGHDIANDGTVALAGLRLHYGVLLDAPQVGGSIEVRVLAGGERRVLRVPMSRFQPLQRYANAYDRLPRYYVYAGLVFVPLSREMLKTQGEDFATIADKHLIHELFQRFMAEPDRIHREPVVLLRRLDHPANVQMAWHRNLIVERVNGREIRGLEDVIAAFENNSDPYHVLEFAYYGRFGVLDRKAADRAHREILEQYDVPSDRRL